MFGGRAKLLRRYCRLLPCVIAACTALPAAADHSALTLEQLLQQEVSGVSRFSQQAREAPSAVTVIGREQIRDHAWQTLAELLDAVPGLFTATDRVYRYVGVRGPLLPSDYNSHVLLLIDGVPANDGIYGQAFIDNAALLDMALIERIEFIPGPGSSIYGSNAILGVINVVTTTGRNLPGTRIDAAGGTHGARGAAVRHGYADDRRDLLLSVSGWQSDGEDVRLGGQRARGLDHDRLRRATARYAWGDFVLLGSWSERRKAYATAPYETEFGAPGTTAEDRQMLVSLSHRSEWRTGLQLSSHLSFGGSDYRADWAYAEGLGRDAADSRWWGAELQATDTRFGTHTLVYGFEYRDQYRIDQRYYDPGEDAAVLDDTRRLYRIGAYLQDEWGDTDWRFNAGLRFDRHAGAGSALSPRLAAIRMLTPQTTLKLVFGSAYRAPNAFERYYHDGNSTAKANPDLQPERIRSLELIAEHIDTSGWQWSGSLFGNRIRDLIAQRDDGGLLMYDNLGRIHARGAVLSVHRAWENGRRVRLSASRHDVEDAGSGERLTHIPRHTAKLDLTEPFGAWRATLEGRFVSRRLTTTDAVGGQAWANLALVSTRPVLGGAQVSLRVDNLFDRELHDPASEEFSHDRLPREGRSALVTLTWPL